MNFYNKDVANNIAFTVDSSIVDPLDLSLFDLHHYIAALCNSTCDKHLLLLEKSIEGTHKNDILWSKRRVYMSRLLARKIILANLNFMEERTYSWTDEVIEEIIAPCPKFDMYNYFFDDDCTNKEIGEVVYDIDEQSYLNENKVVKYFKEKVLKTGGFETFLDEIKPLTEAGRYLCISVLVAKGIIPYLIYKGQKGVTKLENIILKENNLNFREDFDYMMLLYQIENFITQANSFNIHFSPSMTKIWDSIVALLLDAGNFAQEDEIMEFSFTFASFCCMPYPYNHINCAINYAVEYLARDIMQRLEIANTVIKCNKDEKGEEIFEDEDDIDANVYFKIDDVVESILTGSNFEKDQFLSVIGTTDIEAEIDKFNMDELHKYKNENLEVEDNFDITLTFNDNTEE